MNSRAARWALPLLLSVVALVCVDASAAAAPEPPPVTPNEFLPDERNLSECVGVLERPGCGSEERGGSAQTVVFVVMFAAMTLIFARIVVGVRKNRAEMSEP